MVSTAKKNKRKAPREAVRIKHQIDPVFSGDEEDTEITFRPIVRSETDPSRANPTRDSPPTPQLESPGSPASSSETQYGAIMDMVRKLNSEISLITLDNDKIRTVCEKLLHDNRDRDRAVCDLTGLVKRSLDPSSGRLPQPNAFQPHPIIRLELIDNNGNLRATDIGITSTGSDTFLHGVKIVGPDVAEQPTGPRPAASTPYQPVRDHVGCNMSTSPMPGDSRHVYTSAQTTSGEQTRLPAGSTDTAVQQQVVELTVLVQTIPGGCRCTWLGRPSEGLAAGFLSR